MSTAKEWIESHSGTWVQFDVMDTIQMRVFEDGEVREIEGRALPGEALEVVAARLRAWRDRYFGPAVYLYTSTSFDGLTNGQLGGPL